MLRWAFMLVLCMDLGALAGSRRSGIKGTTCPCGNSNKGRIVGGSETKNQYPWMVMLTVRNRRDVMCGASIINTNFAITAAHCTHTLPSYIQLSIIAGTSDVNKGGQVVPVRRWIEHERYSSPATDASKTINDIALLELAKPLQFNTNVGPICMPTSDYPNIERQWVKLTGWGKLGGSKSSTRKLMEADVSVLPFKTCQRLFPLKEPQTQLCTYAPGKGACMGDSGGPLTYLDPETNKYTLVGLVSFGSGDCNPEVPTVMTDVKAFLPWIKSKIHTLGCQKVSSTRRKWDGIVLGG